MCKKGIGQTNNLPRPEQQPTKDQTDNSNLRMTGKYLIQQIVQHVGSVNKMKYVNCQCGYKPPPGTADWSSHISQHFLHLYWTRPNTQSSEVAATDVSQDIQRHSTSRFIPTSRERGLRQRGTRSATCKTSTKSLEENTMWLNKICKKERRPIFSF